MIFVEDAARARKNNSPLNINVLQTTALALVEKAKYSWVSKKKMVVKIALNSQILLEILFPSRK